MTNEPLLINADALDVLPDLDDGSIDLVILDLPYGRTCAQWDRAFDPAVLWRHLRRLLTPRGTVLAFATQPFATTLAAPAADLLKYSLVWRKTRPTAHFHVRNRPLAEHEDILVFSRGTCIHDHASDRRMTYHPVGAQLSPARIRSVTSDIYRIFQRTRVGEPYEAATGAPRSVLVYAKDHGAGHPSAKPVALLEFLIAAYSNPGDVVLDPTAGSGSTLMAAQRLERCAIGIERDAKFCELARERLARQVLPVAA